MRLLFRDAPRGSVHSVVSSGDNDVMRYEHDRHYMNRTAKLLILSLLLSVLFAVSASAQSRRVPQATPTPPTKEDDTVRVDTEEIKLNVTAFDDEGHFISDVRSTDLVVTENDVLHQPSSVRRIPANVLIVMDTGGEMRQIKSLDQTRKTARAIVAALKPEDSIAVVQYADTAEIVAEWTTDKAAVSRAIGRTKFGRRSVFVEALDLARDFLLKNPLENKHLVLITDGTDSGRNLAAKKAAFERLLATEISVHVLSYTRMEAVDIEPRTKGISNSPPPKAMPDEVAAQLPNGVRDVATAPKAKTINLDRTLLRTLKARKADLEESEKQLDSLAENTNGTSVVPESLDEMVDKTAYIAKIIDASYVVTYTPKVPIAETRGPVERIIVVTSKRPGLQIQARRKLIVNPNN